MKAITHSEALFNDEFRKIPDCPESLYAHGNTDLIAAHYTQWISVSRMSTMNFWNLSIEI